jgi:hypothetical protein
MDTPFSTFTADQISTLKSALIDRSRTAKKNAEDPHKHIREEWAEDARKVRGLLRSLCEEESRRALPEAGDLFIPPES